MFTTELKNPKLDVLDKICLEDMHFCSSISCVNSHFGLLNERKSETKMLMESFIIVMLTQGWWKNYYHHQNNLPKSVTSAVTRLFV